MSCPVRHNLPWPLLQSLPIAEFSTFAAICFAVSSVTFNKDALVERCVELTNRTRKRRRAQSERFTRNYRLRFWQSFFLCKRLQWCVLHLSILRLIIQAGGTVNAIPSSLELYTTPIAIRRSSQRRQGRLGRSILGRSHPFKREELSLDHGQRSVLLLLRGGGNGDWKEPPRETRNTSLSTSSTRVLSITETEVWSRGSLSGHSDDDDTESEDDDDWDSVESNTAASKDDGGWRATEAMRWTYTSTGAVCEPPSRHPPEIPLAKENRGGRGEFVGSWKIVTGPGRDPLGWEYSLRRPLPVRRRVWLRSVRLVDDDEEEDEDENKLDESLLSVRGTEEQKRGRRISQQSESMEITDRNKFLSNVTPARWPGRKMWQWVRDDFNFKGFGWTITKSLISLKSFGVAFRTPLTFNFGAWEQNPLLPNVVTSVAVFYPPQIILFLTANMRVECIRYLLQLSFVSALYLLWFAIGNIVRGLALALSVLTYPVTGRLASDYPPFIQQNLELYNPRPSDSVIMTRSVSDGRSVLPPLSLSGAIEERVGVSVSWRISSQRGYEFRISRWHAYTPVLAAIWKDPSELFRFATLIPVRLRQQLTSLFAFRHGYGRSTLTAPAWMSRRMAKVGISTGFPTPDPPYFACAGILSLSGYNYLERRPGSRRSKKRTSAKRQTKVEVAQRAKTEEIEGTEWDDLDAAEENVPSSMEKATMAVKEDEVAVKVAS
jgi:hypothetical protein